MQYSFEHTVYIHVYYIFNLILIDTQIYTQIYTYLKTCANFLAINRNIQGSNTSHSGSVWRFAATSPQVIGRDLGDQTTRCQSTYKMVGHTGLGLLCCILSSRMECVQKNEAKDTLIRSTVSIICSCHQLLCPKTIFVRCFCVLLPDCLLVWETNLNADVFVKCGWET